MFLFFLKKNFCDGWDNMFSLLIVNSIFLLPVAGFAALMMTALLSGAEGLFFVFFFLWAAVLSLQCLAFAPSAAKAADFRGWSVKDCMKALPKSLKDGVLFALIITAIVLIMRVCVPFYFSRASSSASAAMLYAIVGVLFLWLCLFAVLSLQWFAAVTALLPGPFSKRIKKCFILFFDNTAFSFLMLLYGLFLFVLSVLFFGLLPAGSGITLAHTNALRLRLYKYDYLDAHPEYTSRRERKIIPWQSLLAQDKEALGPRTFKSFIFPWKD